MKKLLIIALVALMSVGAMAQQGEGEGEGERKNRNHMERREQIKSMKIGYFTSKLSLSAEQSIEFWPLYNEYRALKRVQYMVIHKLQKKIRAQKATAADINQLIAIKAKLLTVDEECVAKFEKVISLDQIAKMFVAEDDFKSVLVRTFHQGKK